MNRAWMKAVVGCGVLVLGLGAARGAADPDRDASLATVAERSGYAEATASEQVSALVGSLGRSRLVSAGSIGESAGGRAIPVMVIADPPVAWSVDGPGERGLGGRVPVLLFGSIHAGELCGTEALLMLAREIVASREGGQAQGLGAVLDELVVLVVPVYNADGHAAFGENNRPGQNGPAAMGERANAQGLDLNRDWVKMDAPETRAMVGVLNAWDPLVIVDTHTTNGSNHRFTLTYQGPKHPAGSPVVLSYVRDVMLPRVDEAFEAATGYDAYFYGNFAENHTKWTTYPAEPWYGVAYRGLRNRLSILTEAYAYASFEDRVLSTRAFCEAVLRYAAVNGREIEQIVSVAETGELQRGRAGAPLAVKTEARAFAEPATILGYDEPVESGAHSLRAKIDFETTPAKDYEIPILNNFVATEMVRRPAAYVVPREASEVIDRLRAHGVRLWGIGDGAAQEVEAVRYRVQTVETSERVWQNRLMMELGVAPERGSLEVRRGDAIVVTAQPLGSLASYMLEPRSTGGLAAWGFFNGLSAGDLFPVARLDEAAFVALGLDDEE